MFQNDVLKLTSGHHHFVFKLCFEHIRGSVYGGSQLTFEISGFMFFAEIQTQPMSTWHLGEDRPAQQGTRTPATWFGDRRPPNFTHSHFRVLDDALHSPPALCLLDDGDDAGREPQRVPLHSSSSSS